MASVTGHVPLQGKAFIYFISFSIYLPIFNEEKSFGITIGLKMT